MSAPTKGPFHAYQCGEWVFIDDRVGEALAEIVDVSKRDDAMALAHLLAASWEMREALQAVHDWRGLCDADDLETFERIGEMFRKDTGMLRPGKDDVRGHAREKVDNAWYEWTKKKNNELDAQIRAALAKARGEGR